MRKPIKSAVTPGTDDEEFQEALRELERQQKYQDDEDLKAVMQLPQGRRFVYRLVQRIARVMDSSFDGQTNATHFREGRRDVGIEVMNEAQRVAPDEWIRAVTERLAELREIQSAKDEAVRAAEAKAHGD